jgi:hypothetical protein
MLKSNNSEHPKISLTEQNKSNKSGKTKVTTTIGKGLQPKEHKQHNGQRMPNKRYNMMLHPMVDC